MTGISHRSERPPTYRLRLVVLSSPAATPSRGVSSGLGSGRRHTGLRRAGAPIAALELVLRGVLGEVYCKAPLPRKVQARRALSWLCHRTGGVLLGWKIVRLSKRAGRGSSSASSAALPVSVDEAKGGHLHLQRTVLLSDVGTDGCRCSPTVSLGHDWGLRSIGQDAARTAELLSFSSTFHLSSIPDCTPRGRQTPATPHWVAILTDSSETRGQRTCQHPRRNITSQWQASPNLDPLEIPSLADDRWAMLGQETWSRSGSWAVLGPQSLSSRIGRGAVWSARKISEEGRGVPPTTPTGNHFNTRGHHLSRCVCDDSTPTRP